MLPDAGARRAGRRWRIVAILIGVVVATGFGLLYETIVVTAADVALGAEGVPRYERLARLKADTGFLIAGLITQAPFFLFGGFLTARVAGRRELPHGVATAVLCLIAQVVLATGTGGLPWWHPLISVGMVGPAVLLGARWGQRRNEELAAG